MIELTTGAEFSSAIVDLLTTLVAIPLIILLAKTQGDAIRRKKWLHFLILMSVGNFIGFILHAFVHSELTVDLMWIVIYPIMACIEESLLLIALYDLTNGQKPTRKQKTILRSASIVVSIIAIIIGFFTVNEIRTIVIYAVLLDLPALLIFGYMAFKHKHKASQTLFTVFIPQLFGLYFQLTKSGSFHLIWDFNHDGIYHLCLLLSVVIIAISAMMDVKTPTNHNN